MIARLGFFSLIAFVVCVPFLAASEEEFFPWMDVKIVCAERPETGKVIFSAKLAGTKYKEVNIEAFGKRHDLSKEDLARMAGFPLIDLQLTHEAGYAQLGGHTVHVRLKKIFVDAAGQVSKETLVLSVSKGKGLKISEPVKTALADK